MKRLLLIAALLATLAQPTAVLALAGGATLTAQSSTSNPAINETFTVTVQMDTKTHKVTAADLRLTFPSDKLQATSIVKSDFLPENIVSGTVGTGTANIAVGSGTVLGPKQGVGPVAIVTFKALAAGSAVIGFASQTQIADDSSPVSQNITDTLTPVTVTIGGVQATVSAQATAAAQSSTSPAAVSSPAGTTAASPVASQAAAAAGTSRTPTPRPSSPAQTVSRVSTGPIETTLIAIILGSIGTLLYVGYMGSDSFRRSEARSIASQDRKHESDFRDTV